MAIIYKTNLADWTSWSGSPSATNDGYVGALASPTQNYTLPSTVTLSSIAITPEYTPSALTLTRPSGSGQNIIRSGGINQYSGYSIYVHDGKNVTLGPSITFADNNTSNHDIYVGTGGTLSTPVLRANTAGTNNVRKEGPGLLDLQDTQASNALATFTIAGGTVSTYRTTAVQFIAPTTYFENGGVFRLINSCTIPTAVVFTGAGTISTDPGQTVIFNSTFTGSGTFTKSGTGTLSLTATSLGMPLNVDAGTLSIASGYNLTGATLTGAGTISLLGAHTISSDAPSFTGAISGDFTYNAPGVTRTFGGNAQGIVTVTAASGAVVCTAVSTGRVDAIASGSVLSLTGNGRFNGTGGTTTLGLLNSGAATLDISGSTAGFAASRTIALRFGSRLLLRGGASVPNTVAPQTETATTEIRSEDTNTNTITGAITQNGVASSGTDNISALTGGTLVVAGTVTGTNAGRTWDFNGTSASYAGTVKLTGSVAGSGPARLSRGVLHLNSSSSSGFSAGLAVTSGTLACSSSGAYAAQLAGNVTLAAGSTLKFGAPA